jgi:hypothetical protein
LISATALVDQLLRGDPDERFEFPLETVVRGFAAQFA